MFFLFTFDNAPGSDARRAATVELHRAYLKQTVGRLLAGGPVMEADGETLQGGLYIIEAETAASAQEWVNADPFTKAGIRVNMRLSQWRKAVFNRAYVLGQPDAPDFQPPTPRP
jgi:uncharacterized protein YciI